MQNITHIIDRLKKLKGFKSDTDVARALDMKRTALSSHKTRDSIPFPNLYAFCNTEGVSLDWLLTGEGPKCRDESINKVGKRQVSAGSSSPPNLDLMREVIEDVEELFNKKKLSLPPQKKAELIILLYEEVLEDESKKEVLGGKILRLAKLAS